MSYPYSSQSFPQYQQGSPYAQAAPAPQGYPYAQPPYAQGYPSPPQSYPLTQPPHPPTSTQQRPIIFLFTHNEDILNCQVDDPFGNTPFRVSTEKKVTSFKAADGNVIAVIDWDHSSPVMVYKGQKIKCREWLRVIHDKEKGIKGKAFAYHGKEYVATVPEKRTVAWVGLDRPEYPMAVLRAFGDDAGLEVFPDVFHNPGLLEDFLLATVMICSKKLGDGGSTNWGATLFHDVLLSVVSGA